MIERVEADALIAAAVVPPREPAPGVVPLLEDILGRAQRGEIVSVAIVFVESDDSSGNAFEACAAPMTMLAAIMRMVHRYHGWMDWRGRTPLEGA
jgi:hypothetical protein